MDKVQRFWRKVQRCEHGEMCPDCCWLWTGTKTRGGYGNVGIRQDGRPVTMRAHRLSWILTHGEIPAGMLALHNCPTGDNPACVNPAHLWIGTHLENQQDSIAKGRKAVGERHGLRLHPEAAARGEAITSTRLTREQVSDIRYLAAHGMSQLLLGRLYAVSSSTIGKIERGETWAHLPLIREER